MPRSPRVLKSLNSIEKLNLEFSATFNGNLCTTITCCWTPTNANDETSITSYLPLCDTFPNTTFWSSVENMNAHIDKNGNNKIYFYNSPNRNCEYQAIFSWENKLACRGTKFKKKEKKLLTNTNPNNLKSLQDYIFRNKNWINSALNWEA